MNLPTKSLFWRHWCY